MFFKNISKRYWLLMQWFLCNPIAVGQDPPWELSAQQDSFSQLQGPSLHPFSPTTQALVWPLR